MWEMFTVHRMLKGKTDSKLLRLPAMTDDLKVKSLQMLNLVWLNAVTAEPELAGFIILRMMRITLESGRSVLAPVAFANYGILCATRDVSVGYRFGALAITLLEGRYGGNEYLPRVYAAFYGCVFLTLEPLLDSLEPLRIAYKTGLQTGDIEGACHCALIYISNAWDAGVPLPQLARECSIIRERMDSSRQKRVLELATPMMQLIQCLANESGDPLSPVGPLVDLDSLLASCNESGKLMASQVIRLSRMVVAYIFDDCVLGERMAAALEENSTLAPSYANVHLPCVGALIAVACAREGRQRLRNIRHARRTIRMCRRWAANAPRNFLDKEMLLRAELASLMGRTTCAFQYYHMAIALAKDNGLQMWLCKAQECTSRHFLRNGDLQKARSYMEASLKSYRDWGALAKCRILQGEFDALFLSK